MSFATHTVRHPLSPASRWTAALCALSVWLLGVLAASSQLHGGMHAEAGHDGHTCAVTLFSEGLDDPVGSAEIVIMPAWLRAGEMVAVQTAPASKADDRLPPGRGPPFC